MGLNLRDRDKRKAPDRANWAEVGGFCGPDENPYRAAYLQFQGSGREYLDLSSLVEANGGAHRHGRNGRATAHF